MLSDSHLDISISEWLREDIPSFDVGGHVVGNGIVEAHFLLKSNAVVAGFPFAETLMRALGCSVTWHVAEGTYFEASGSVRTKLGTVKGPANRVLQGERTALELLTRSSACATYAKKCVDAARAANPSWKGKVAATRKTTPGSLRQVEKYGALVGGADPHRYSLSAMVMLKDNHIDVAGSISKAVQKARTACGFSMKVEVECRSESDAVEAATAGADVVMLDNFSPEAAALSAPRIKAQFPHIIVELSGGISDATIGQYALEGVDIVSIGKITHGPPPVDVSMKIRTMQGKL